MTQDPFPGIYNNSRKLNVNKTNLKLQNLCAFKAHNLFPLREKKYAQHIQHLFFVVNNTKTVNIALIWAFSFEGALTNIVQQIGGSSIKDETKKSC